MKTSFFKKILPMLAILLAIGGAFGSYAMDHSATKKGKAAVFTGYIKNNPLGSNCTESVQCTDVVAELCTVNGAGGGAQLWKMNGQNRCVDEIYRIH